MEAGGWLVNAEGSAQCEHSPDHPNYGEYDTFWGFNGIHPTVGYAQATFKGVGTAILDFKNCYKSGLTKVYLNGLQIGSADAFQSKVISFSYKSGDTLKITEDLAMFKINSLRLIGCK